MQHTKNRHLRTIVQLCRAISSADRRRRDFWPPSRRAGNAAAAPRAEPDGPPTDSEHAKCCYSYCHCYAIVITAYCLHIRCSFCSLMNSHWLLDVNDVSVPGVAWFCKTSYDHNFHCFARYTKYIGTQLPLWNMQCNILCTYNMELFWVTFQALLLNLTSNSLSSTVLKVLLNSNQPLVLTRQSEYKHVLANILRSLFCCLNATSGSPQSRLLQ